MKSRILGVLLALSLVALTALLAAKQSDEKFFSPPGTQHPAFDRTEYYALLTETHNAGTPDAYLELLRYCERAGLGSPELRRNVTATARLFYRMEQPEQGWALLTEYRDRCEAEFGPDDMTALICMDSMYNNSKAHFPKEKILKEWIRHAERAQDPYHRAEAELHIASKLYLYKDKRADEFFQAARNRLEPLIPRERKVRLLLIKYMSEQEDCLEANDEPEAAEALANEIGVLKDYDR